MKPGTSIVNTDEYIELKEFKKNVLKGNFVTFTTNVNRYGQQYEKLSFYTESESIKKASEYNQKLQRELEIDRKEIYKKMKESQEAYDRFSITEAKDYTIKQLLSMIWEKIFNT